MRPAQPPDSVFPRQAWIFLEARAVYLDRANFWRELGVEYQVKKYERKASACLADALSVLEALDPPASR